MYQYLFMGYFTVIGGVARLGCQYGMISTLSRENVEKALTSFTGRDKWDVIYSS